MNPELVRNYWQEFTPLKAWAVPVIVFLLVVLLNADAKSLMAGTLNWEGMQATGVGIFCFFALWGAYRCSNAVTSEVGGGTWDQQRLAPHRPGDLVAGKLFGVTCFDWYAGAFGLGMYAIGALAREPMGSVGLNALTLVLGALWVQAGALLVSLSGAGAVRAMRRPNVGGGGVGGVVLVIFLASMVGPGVAEMITNGRDATAIVPWYVPVPIRVFVPASIALFLGWTLVGAYQVTRAELQERVGPGPWLAFLGFVTLYLYPFAVSDPFNKMGGGLAVLAAVATMVWGFAVPPLLLAERMDLVRARALAAAWRRADVAALWDQAPLWTLTLAGYAAALAVVAVMGGMAKSVDAFAWCIIGVALMLQVLRDAGWMLAVYLAPKPHRNPKLIVLFWLGMLYMLLPAVVGAVAGTESPPFWVILPPASMMSSKDVTLTVLPWAVPGLIVAWGFGLYAIRRAMAEPQQGGSA